MFGKAKKNVSLAYKEKLLAEIAHYEKRIEEALNKRKQNSFVDESVEEDIVNPYKLNLQPSQYELKQQEASLSDRASMTLELGMLTIMQSEVNVMVTPPEVRKPVPEDGTWHEVAAECKIDLVSFTITFYAHKPHRRFAPTRYRNVVVTLVKPAHQKELAQSILPKLHLPNLALQVLQSYATAFRSRRTTLLELAEKYADKLKMQAMPDGGYRVMFLELLQVEWTLENLWSPIVPFCHRMKFEVEYMPKDYIQAIGKLYKQFKDPSLDTPERTLVLSRIFDICLQAAGPARELQESFESDPETTGCLHERRTTIDQEPDVPNVEQSPKKKEPSGKENKPHNRKTSMAPPKTLPKKAKKSKANDKDVIENRKSVKRAIESENSNVSKKSRVEDDSSKTKGGLKGGKDGLDKSDETREAGIKTKYTGKDAANRGTEVAGLDGNNPKKAGKPTAKNAKESYSAVTDSEIDVRKKRDGKIIKSKENAENGNADGDGDITNATKNKEGSKGSEATSKRSKKEDSKTNDKVKAKDINVENNAARSKKSAENIVNIRNDKNTEKNSKDTNVETNVVNSKKGTENKTNSQNVKTTEKKTVMAKYTEKENEENAKKGADSTAKNKDGKKVAKTKKDEGSVASSKQGTEKREDDRALGSKEKNTQSDVAASKNKAPNKEDVTKAANTKDNSTKNKLTHAKKADEADSVNKTSSKTVAAKEEEGKIKASSKKLKDTNKNGLSKNVPKNAEMIANVNAAVGTDREGNDKTVAKKPIPKDSNTTKPKEVVNTNEVDEKKAKQTDKVIGNSKLAKEKTTETEKKTAKEDTNKEKARIAEKRTITTSKTNEQTEIDKPKITGDKTSKNDVTAKKKRTTEVNTKNIETKQPKSTANKNENPKISIPENATKTLKVNTNRDETENVDKNGQKKITTQKTQKSNMLNITITKSKSISKLPAEKQTQIADKLKTKIPMMKSKITFSSLGDKMKMTNLGRISKGVENTKIPQKKLPVFKKLVKILPTRMSPRKLPSFRPSSHGFLSK